MRARTGLGLVVGLATLGCASVLSSGPDCAPQCDDGRYVGVDYGGVNLQGSSFKRAVFDGADLRGVDLTRARMDGAKMLSVELDGADLSNANLSGAELNSVRASGARFVRADLRGARIQKVKMDGANFTEADLTGAIVDQFGDAVWTGARIDFATYDNSYDMKKGDALKRLRDGGAVFVNIDEFPPAVRHEIRQGGRIE